MDSDDQSICMISLISWIFWMWNFHHYISNGKEAMLILAKVQSGCRCNTPKCVISTSTPLDLGTYLSDEFQNFTYQNRYINGYTVWFWLQSTSRMYRNRTLKLKKRHTLKCCIWKNIISNIIKISSRVQQDPYNNRLVSLGDPNSRYKVIYGW